MHLEKILDGIDIDPIISDFAWRMLEKLVRVVASLVAGTNTACSFPLVALEAGMGEAIPPGAQVPGVAVARRENRMGRRWTSRD